MVSKKWLTIVSLIFCNSCIFVIGEDKPLTFARTDYHGSSLRLDGYYYTTSSVIENPIKVYFFYRNGSIHTLGAFSPSDKPKLDSIMLRPGLLKQSRESKISWGLYKIEKDSISYEMWYARSHELVPYISKGVITSDTTFEINEWMRPDGSEKKPYQETLRFKKFHPKPDSTNEFLE